MDVDVVNIEECPLCTGHSRFDCSKDAYQIFRCDDCDFLFVHPYPTPDELKDYYSANYRGANEGFYPKLNSRKRRALVKSLRFLRFTYRKKVLDIGCGGGIMAETFRRFGAQSYGIDISENSINFARSSFPKCTFFCETFDEMLARGLQFDFIFTTELMEHLAGPHEIMRFIAASSKPGTVVYIATPDAGHKRVPDDLTSWVDICPPEHLQWFNKHNIGRIFDAYGFSLMRGYAKRNPALSLLFRKR